MSRKQFLLTALGVCSLFAATLQRGERDRAMSHLHATRKQFLDSIDGLSEAQWNFKPDAKSWSVAEVAEHVALSEETIGGMIYKLVATPAKQVDLKANDEMILKGIVDRGKKFTAPEMLQPVHRWKTRQELAASFKASRDKLIAYVDTTPDDLRSRTAPHPVFKEMDGYQWIMMLSGHCERHTQQILEVKANPGFPRK